MIIELLKLKERYIGYGVRPIRVFVTEQQLWEMWYGLPDLITEPQFTWSETKHMARGGRVGYYGAPQVAGIEIRIR